MLAELPDKASQQRAFQIADLNARPRPNDPEMVASLGWVNYKLNRMGEAELARLQPSSIPE